jgi:DNA-damage-inducible protein D
MSDALVLFQSDGEFFEDAGRVNGGRYWFAREFMQMLGYESYSPFEQAINRAIGTCTTLKIPVVENFQQVDRSIDGGSPVADYKLSRFACYLVAMNGDVRKAPVAAAQAYFATLAEAARQYMQASNDMERVLIRDEISDRERSLSSTAKQHGVDQYQFFQNAGYRGMYNMNLSALKERKGLSDKKRSLLDFMDKRESAGNLFRLTETEAKLKADSVRGQKPAEQVAFDVGKKVRKMMIDTDGTRPESIPLAGDINEVRKNLKQTAKEFTKLDTPAEGRGKKPLPPADQ